MRSIAVPLVLLLSLSLAPAEGHPPARRLDAARPGAAHLRFTTRFRDRSFRALATGDGVAMALDGRGALLVREGAGNQWVRRAAAASDEASGNFTDLVLWQGTPALGSPFSGVALRGPAATRRLGHPEGRTPGRIRALETHEGELWVIADGGMLRVSPGSLEIREEPLPEGLRGAPAALVRDRASLVLASDSLGLARRVGPTWQQIRAGDEAAPGPVRALAAGAGGLWLGGPGWLVRADPETGELLDLLAEEPRLGRVVVSDLLVQGDDLWVATLGQGLLRRVAGTWEQHLPPQVDLGSPMVHALASEGDDQLLVATSHGLTHVDTRRRGQDPDDVEAWIPRRDVPTATDLSRTDPEPRQLFATVTRGGKLSPLAARGDVLFEDPSILGERARRAGISCGTCHPRGHMNTNLFFEGLSLRRGGVDLSNRHFSARAENHVLDPVDTPSLRGLRFTAPYGRTQQAPDIRTFTRNVIVLEFEGAEPDDLTLDALTQYQRAFDFLPARWVDDQGRLSPDAPDAVRRGEALFVRPDPRLPGGSCAACHPKHGYFTDGRMHDIGTGGGFDVPSLRNANYSPPYMHDGRFATYAEVIRHFDEYFGLDLAAGERADLEAYLTAVGEGLRPYE